MRIHSVQTSFITGQLDEAAAARSESALYRNGARRLRNCEPNVTGGVKSRRGSRHLQTLSGPAVLHPFEFSLSQSYIAAFQAGRVDFFYAADGAAAGSLTGCPWISTWLRELRTIQLGDVMWVTHPDMPVQKITRTGTNTWALAAWAADSTRGTPTFRYAAPSITCQVGGTVAQTLTLAALPTVGGVSVVLAVGMAGQARVAAGPGPWFPFFVTAISNLILTVAWTAGGLAPGAGLEVQLDAYTTIGGGGGAPGDPGGSAGGGTGDAGGGGSG